MDRISTQSRIAMQGVKNASSYGGGNNPKQLDCRPPQLQPNLLAGGRPFVAVTGGAAIDDGYRGGLLPRIPSDDYGETSLLLPKNSKISGRKTSFQSSPTPSRGAASSIPFSPPSQMFCSHGASSDSYSPSAHEATPPQPEGGRRRGKEPVGASFELEFHQMSLQEELPLLLRRPAETKTAVRTSNRRRSTAPEDIPASFSALRDAHIKLTAALHEQATHAADRPSSSGAGDNGGSSSSGDENSDVESAIDDHLRRATRRIRGAAHFPASGSEMSKIDARLEQWAEARTIQLLRKLKKKEDEIAEWESLKTMKARMQMRELEVKLEEKREKAMEKMQRSILSAQRKAERKKQKERASADRKVMEVVGAVEKREGSSGKMPCKLICL